MAQAPPSAETHLSVADLELCEIAMKWTEGYLFANRRSSRKVFSVTDTKLVGQIPRIPISRSIQGHPVCLKNTITVGLPSGPGNLSLVEFGALVPQTGGDATSTGGGGGVAHDCHDFGTERLVNGFAKAEGALGSLASGFDS